MTFDPTDKENCLMTDSATIYRYIHGRNGHVTLVSPKSNKAHSYYFCPPANERDFPENTIFAYVIHDNHKMYLGMLDGSGFRRTRGSTFSEDTEAMRGVRYIVKMANQQDLVNSKQMLLYHSGKCCMCGRPLETKKALKLGIGKKCLAKYTAMLNWVPWDGN